MRAADARSRQACAAAGVGRIIYLSGLGGEDDELSEHLASRQATGDALRSAGVPVTELRAAVIVGSGSASFEIMRDLTRRLPAMVAPRWVSSRCEPIAIRDVVRYLVGCLGEPRTAGEIFEIGCGTVLTYREMLRVAAEEQRRPFRMVTRAGADADPLLVLAAPRHERRHAGRAAADRRAAQRRRLPRSPDRRAAARADARATARRCEPRSTSTRRERRSRWVDAHEFRPAPAASAPPAGAATGRVPRPAGVRYAARGRGAVAAGGAELRRRGRLRREGRRPVAPARRADRLLGGAGLRRGRPAGALAEGDAVDWWRVERLERGRTLQLVAEMRVPGDRPARARHRADRRTARASCRRPRSANTRLASGLYWYAVAPFHDWVFRELGAHLMAEPGRT